MSESKRSSHSGASPPRPAASQALSPPQPAMQSSHAHAPSPALSPFGAAPSPPPAALSPPPGPASPPPAHLSPMAPPPSSHAAAPQSLSAPVPLASGAPAPAQPAPAQPAPAQPAAPPPAVAAAAAPRRQIPATIDGRPAIQSGVAADGRRVFAPLRNPADASQGTSPYPHYSEAADGGPGHLSDLSVHTPAAGASTIARYRQTYVAPLGGQAPANRTDRYADTADGRMQRRAQGQFTPEAQAEPLSPRTRNNAAPRTDITFQDEP